MDTSWDTYVTLYISTPSLLLPKIEFTPEHRKERVSEAVEKWSKTKAGLDKFREDLVSTILDKIQTIQIDKFGQGVKAFIKNIQEQVLYNYPIFADLYLSIQENNELVAENYILRELGPVLQGHFIHLNISTLQAALPTFGGRLLFDSTAIVNGASGQDNVTQKEVHIKVSEASPEIEKHATKPIKTAQLKEVLHSFESTVRSSFNKKVESIRYRLKSLIDAYYVDAMQELGDGIGKILAKLTYFQNLEDSQDPTVNEVNNESIDKFFVQNYDAMLIDIESKVATFLADENITNAQKICMNKFIDEIKVEKETITNRQSLDEYFLNFDDAGLVCSKIPRVCLNLIKDQEPPFKIDICEAKAQQQLVSLSTNPIVKFNHTYFLQVEDSSSSNENIDKIINKDEGEDVILLTTDLEYMKGHQIIDLKTNFLPSNLELPKEEIMLIYFFVRLTNYYGKRQQQNLLDSDDQILSLEISLPAFFSFSLKFLSEIIAINFEKRFLRRPSSILIHPPDRDSHSALISEQKIKKRVDTRPGFSKSEHEIKPMRHAFTNDTIQEEEVKDHVEPEHIEQIETQHTERFDANSYRVNTLEDFDDIEFAELGEVDAMWESSDFGMFIKFLEQSNCKFLNDLKTLKEVSGFQDYIFVDKNDSLEIFKEFVAYQKTRASSNYTNPVSQRVLLPSYSPFTTKGIIFLFTPASNVLNLVCLKIDFETKSKTFFVIETQQQIDLVSFKNILNQFINFVKKTIQPKNTVKFEFSKYKENYIFLHVPTNMPIEHGFRNFYFPYIHFLKEEFSSSRTEQFSMETLKDVLNDFLRAAFSTAYGLEQTRNLTQVYQLYTSRFTNIFMIEEFPNLDLFYAKVQQYLQLCFVDSLQPAAKKIKSVFIFGRIFNDKNRNYDFVVIFFEYTHAGSYIIGNDKTHSPALKKSNSGIDRPTSKDFAKLQVQTESAERQRFYVFGDTYLYVLQVRNIVKSFFIDREAALKRVQFTFYQMKKSKAESNLFLLHKSILHCVVSVLLNEGLQISDVVSICRLSPATQINYLSLALEKIRSLNQSSIMPKRKTFVNEQKAIRITIPSSINLVEETFNTIGILGLNQPEILKWLAEISSIGGLKRIVVPMILGEKNDLSFKINQKDLKLPLEPFTLVLVSNTFSSANPNICNIIEPDGSVFILRIAFENEPQYKPDKLSSSFIKCVEQAQKLVPKIKLNSNAKPVTVIHTMLLKHISSQDVGLFFDFIIMFYLLKYRSTKDGWFVISENSLLSLIFSDLRIFFRNEGESLKLVQTLQESRFIPSGNALIERCHKYYHEESLVAIFAIFYTTMSAQSLIFCIQNDMEYAFHVVAKGAEQNHLDLIVIVLRDQSHGSNAVNFYQDVLHWIERDITTEDIQCSYHILKVESLPSFFYSIEPNLLELGLADAIRNSKGFDKLKAVKEYLLGWYQPTILSSQMVELSSRINIGI